MGFVVVLFGKSIEARSVPFVSTCFQVDDTEFSLLLEFKGLYFKQ